VGTVGGRVRSVGGRVRTVGGRVNPILPKQETYDKKRIVRPRALFASALTSG